MRLDSGKLARFLVLQEIQLIIQPIVFIAGGHHADIKDLGNTIDYCEKGEACLQDTVSITLRSV